jgi:hypothetical protein
LAVAEFGGELQVCPSFRQADASEILENFLKVGWAKAIDDATVWNRDAREIDPLGATVLAHRAQQCGFSGAARASD